MMRFPFRGPGGDRSFNAAMFLGVGIWFGVEGWKDHSRIISLIGAGIMVLGVGLWVAYPWVRWPSALFLLCLSAFNFYTWRQGGPSVWSLLANVGILWVAWTVIRDKGKPQKDPGPSNDEERPLVSIVLLLREPRYLDSTILASQLSRAWGGEFFAHTEGGPSPPQGDVRDARIVSGESPLFVALAREGIFVIHNQDKPYVARLKVAAADVPDPRAREAILKHQAWMAVDLRSPLAPAGPIESYYPSIGRAAAELADEDVLAIFHPASIRLGVWNAALLEVLRGPAPLDAFTVPVDSPRARRAWEGSE